MQNLSKTIGSSRGLILLIIEKARKTQFFRFGI